MTGVAAALLSVCFPVSAVSASAADKSFIGEIFSALSGDAAIEEWRQHFNEGEALVLEGRMDEAEAVFVDLIRMWSGKGEPESSRNWFSRLNRSHFQRFPVRANLARGGDVFGTNENLLFSLFGMPDRVNTQTFADVYDAAIVYWQEIVLLSGDGSRFGEELNRILHEERGNAAEEVLALGIAGFPRPLLCRVVEYVENESADPDVDSFILQVINRYVPSVDRMPDLRDPMATLTERVGARLADTMESPDERLRIVQRQAHILGRLNEPERVRALLDREIQRNHDMGAAGAQANLALALRLEDYAEGAALFQRLWGMEDEDLPASRTELNRARIYLAGIGLRSGEAAASAAFLAEYAHYLLSRSTPESDMDAFLLHSFWWEPQFPGFNPYLRDDVVQPLAQFLPELADSDQIDLFLQVLNRGMAERSLPKAVQKQIAFLSACTLWWFGDRDQALSILREQKENDSEFTFTFLVASMEVRLFQEAEPLLTALPEELSPDSYSADVFLYLLGGQWRRFDLLREAARRILRRPLSVEEKEQWASRFLQDSLYEETGAILASLEPSEVDINERERFLAVTFRYYQRVGRAKEKAPLARDFLLQRPPVDFDGWNDSVRRLAIELLRSAGELEDYRKDVGEILELDPGAQEGLLLLAELTVPTDREKGRLSPDELQVRLNETQALLEKAVGTEASDYDNRLDYGLWLYDNEYYEEAAALFDVLINIDPVPLFVDQSLLFGAYEGAGRLAELVSIFDAWRMPYAASIDTFYGLQPTSHLLGNLGGRLQQQGEVDASVAAWKHCVRLNPVLFTEETRVMLMNELVTAGETEESMELFKDYLFRESSEITRFVVHPFPSILPPWLNAPSRNGEGTQSPFFSLLDVVATGGMESDLLENAKRWRMEIPGDLSRRGFLLLMLARDRNPLFFSEWDSFFNSGDLHREGRESETGRALLRLLLPILEAWEPAEDAVLEIKHLLE